ncbi:MAG TPA: hypothetical protein VHE60_07085 [Pyrinomonadaceae bacterium]|nr:hypothetical protein [Pyrinomonadaceae bacterium]
MKKFFSIVLLTSLASTSMAQSGVTRPPDATKPIQQSESAVAISAPTQPQRREVKLPAGTPIDIEATYTVSSLDFRPGDFLSFRVLVSVMIDSVTLIDKNSLVTGRVVEAKRGRHWGKAGRLSWTMQDVVAVDGTRVALQAQKDLPTGRNGIKGTSHGGEVATKTILMGALLAPLFPIAPLALLSGFRRGEDAVLPQGKRFVVFVQRDANITAPAERSGR